jgi:hypothetical protein
MRLVFGRILSFGVAEIPNLIALHTLRTQIANVGIVVGSARSSHINEQLEYSVFADSGHADSGADGIAFDQGGYYLHTLLNAQAVHGNILCLSSQECQE